MDCVPGIRIGAFVYSQVKLDADGKQTEHSSLMLTSDPELVVSPVYSPWRFGDVTKLCIAVFLLLLALNRSTTSNIPLDQWMFLLMIIAAIYDGYYEQKIHIPLLLRDYMETMHRTRKDAQGFAVVSYAQNML